MKIKFWLFFALTIVLATYFAARTIMLWPLPARKISVNFSGQSLPAENFRNPNLNSILAIPEVETASVRRLPNGNIAVKVQTKRAVAVWTDGEFFYPLTIVGARIEKPLKERPAGLVFHGAIPADISAIVPAAKMIPNINYLEWVESRRWNIILSNGAVIKLPEENFAAAIDKLRGTNILNKKISVIDLRDSARILVK